MAKEKEKLIMKLDNLKIKNLRKKAFSDSSHDQLFACINIYYHTVCFSPKKDDIQFNLSFNYLWYPSSFFFLKIHIFLSI